MPTRWILYPALHQPVLTQSQDPETTSLDRWYQPLSEPVRSRPPKNVAIAGPFLVKADLFPETVSLDRWYAPLSEPIVKSAPPRQTAGPAFLERQFAETVSLDRWQQPLSEPVRRVLKNAGIVSETEASATFAETVSIDRWLQPLSEPALRHLPYTNPAIISPTLVQGTPFAESVSIDRWLVPLAEPVRTRLPTNVGIAGAFLVRASFAETTSLDRWYAALSEPVRRVLKNVGEAAQLLVQSSFREATTLDRWFTPLSEPVRRIAQPQHLNVQLVRQPAPAELITVDKWLAPLADPTRRIPTTMPEAVRPAPVNLPITLDPNHKTSDFTLSGGNLTCTKTAGIPGGIGLSTTAQAFGKWYFEFRALVNGASGREVGIGLANNDVVVTNYVGSDGLSLGYYNNGEVIQDFGTLGVPVATIQTFAVNDWTAIAFDKDAELIWFKNLTTGSNWNNNASANPATGVGGIAITVPKSLFVALSTTVLNDSAIVNFGASAFVGVAPSGFAPLDPNQLSSEVVTSDKWFSPLSEPVRVQPPKNVGIAGSVLVERFFPETVSLDRWLVPLSEPVRSLPPKNVGIISPTLVQRTFAETTSLDRWYAPLSEPVRRVLKNAGESAQALVETSFAETVSLDRWFAPFSDPTRRGTRPFLDPVAPVQVPAPPEVVTVDKWFAPFGVPVRGVFKNVGIVSPTLVKAAPFIETTTLDRWYAPFSEPVRKAPPKNVGIAGPSLVESKPFAESVSIDRWQQPFSEPVRTLPPKNVGIGATLVQRTFAESVSIDRWQQPLSEPTRRIQARDLFFESAPFSTFIPSTTRIVRGGLDALIQKTINYQASCDAILYTAVHATPDRTVNITARR